MAPSCGCRFVGARFRRRRGLGRRRRRGEGLRGHQRLAHLRRDPPDQLAIRRVARLDRDQVPAQRPAQQRQVAHDVEHLVPDEFLRIAQRLGRQHRVVANHHRVLQAAALDQAVLDQVFDLLVEAERARVRQVALPGLGRQFDAVELGEPALLVRAGAGDLERLVREERHHRLAHLQFDRRGHRVGLAAFVLRHDARALDHLAILPRAAVGDGRLIGVQFDDGVVDAVAGKGRQHVLDGVNARVALGQGGRAVVLDHVLHARLDFRLALQVHAAEADAGVGRGRQEGHGHPVAAVQADAGIARRAIECLLL